MIAGQERMWGTRIRDEEDNDKRVVNVLMSHAQRGCPQQWGELTQGSEGDQSSDDEGGCIVKEESEYNKGTALQGTGVEM